VGNDGWLRSLGAASRPVAGKLFSPPAFRLFEFGGQCGFRPQMKWQTTAETKQQTRQQTTGKKYFHNDFV
jgi:uncharacterized membrane protein YGL010W